MEYSDMLPDDTTMHAATRFHNEFKLQHGEVCFHDLDPEYQDCDTDVKNFEAALSHIEMMKTSSGQFDIPPDTQHLKTIIVYLNNGVYASGRPEAQKGDLDELLDRVFQDFSILHFLCLVMIHLHEDAISVRMILDLMVNFARFSMEITGGPILDTISALIQDDKAVRRPDVMVSCFLILRNTVIDEAARGEVFSRGLHVWPLEIVRQGWDKEDNYLVLPTAIKLLRVTTRVLMNPETGEMLEEEYIGACFEAVFKVFEATREQREKEETIKECLKFFATCCDSNKIITVAEQQFQLTGKLWSKLDPSNVLEYMPYILRVFEICDTNGIEFQFSDTFFEEIKVHAIPLMAKLTIKNLVSFLERISEKWIEPMHRFGVLNAMVDVLRDCCYTSYLEISHFFGQSIQHFPTLVDALPMDVIIPSFMRRLLSADIVQISDLRDTIAAIVQYTDQLAPLFEEYREDFEAMLEENLDDDVAAVMNDINSLLFE